MSAAGQLAELAVEVARWLWREITGTEPTADSLEAIKDRTIDAVVEAALARVQEQLDIIGFRLAASELARAAAAIRAEILAAETSPTVPPLDLDIVEVPPGEDIHTWEPPEGSGR